MTRGIMGTIFALLVERIFSFVQHHLYYNRAISSTEMTNAEVKGSGIFSSLQYTNS